MATESYQAEVCTDSPIDLYWAYDYEIEDWVTGEKAVYLLIDQVKAELALLSSAHRDEYWKMLKEKGGKSCHDYKAELEKQLRTYYNELGNNLELPEMLS